MLSLPLLAGAGGLVFSRLKQVFRSSVESDAIEAARTGTRCDAVFHAMYDAMDAALQPAIIQKSFADGGIWRWNKDIVLENAKKWCVGTSSNVTQGLTGLVNHVVNEVVLALRSRMSQATGKRTRAD